MNKFKVGDKVTPNDRALFLWGEYLTKGKIYTVVLHEHNDLVVYDDKNQSYWSSVGRWFDKARLDNEIGGKLL